MTSNNRCLISDVCCLTSDFIFVLSDVWQVILYVWCQISYFRYLISDVWCQVSDNQMSDDRCLISDVWWQVSDIRRLLSDFWFQFSVIRRLTSDFRCLMSDVSFQMSDVRRLISDVSWEIQNKELSLAYISSNISFYPLSFTVAVLALVLGSAEGWLFLLRKTVKSFAIFSNSSIKKLSLCNLIPDLSVAVPFLAIACPIENIITSSKFFSKQASYEELARGFEPITTGDIFWVMIVKTMIINNSFFLSLDFWISFSLVTKWRNKFCKQLL